MNGIKLKTKYNILFKNLLLCSAKNITFFSFTKLITSTNGISIHISRNVKNETELNLNLTGFEGRNIISKTIRVEPNMKVEATSA
jgi:hypothetical protein